MGAIVLSMRERLEAVHGDLLALEEDETLEELLGDLGPEEKNGPKCPNSRPLLMFEDKLCSGF